MGYVVKVDETFAGSDFRVVTMRARHGAASEEYYIGGVPRPVNSGQFMTTGIVHLQFSSPSVMLSKGRRPDASRYEVTLGGIISPSKKAISKRFSTFALNDMLVR